jgi:uncharacterized protein (DUF2336 family)
MIVKRFLLWMRVASAEQRAQAVAALAGAFLYADLEPQDRLETEAALTAMLDDPSPLVRRALAETMADSADAPRPIIVGLANDLADIAAIVLERSPVLAIADLVDGAAIGDATVQVAVARRQGLPSPVAAALAEVGVPSALAALAANRSAALAPFSLRRMHERHGGDPDVREALLARDDLPADVRQSIVAEVAQALSSFVVGCRWMSAERSARVVREATERATLVIAHDTPGAAGELVRHLRETSQLTPAFILRAVLSAEMSVVEAAFAELAGMNPKRVGGLLRDRGAGFAALYRKAGLPLPLYPAFAAALSAARQAASGSAGRMSREMVANVIAGCEAGANPTETTALVALLRRFETEAAREEARALTEKLADHAALTLLIENDPGALVIENEEGPALLAAA